MEAKKVLEADLDKDRKQLEAFEKRFECKRARLEGLSDRLQNSPQLHQRRGSGGRPAQRIRRLRRVLLLPELPPQATVDDINPALP